MTIVQIDKALRAISSQLTTCEPWQYNFIIDLFNRLNRTKIEILKGNQPLNDDIAKLRNFIEIDYFHQLKRARIGKLKRYNVIMIDDDVEQYIHRIEALLTNIIKDN